MKMMNKRTKLILVVLVIAVIIFYNSGPSILHSYYKNQTDTEQINANRTTYNYVSLKISKHEGDKELKLKRDSLYQWFHIRGIQIDEGHDGLSNYDKWNEFFDYWFWSY